MSLGRNLRKGRSHIIFIIGLLAASAVVLELDPDERELAGEVPPPPVDPSAPPSPPAQQKAASADAAAPERRDDLRVQREGAAEWQIQLGAFSTSEAARAHKHEVKRALEEVGSLRPRLVPRNGLTAVRAGPLPDAAEAHALCRHVRTRGFDCDVVRP